MRKVRKKWLSILLTLAMLVGLMVPFAGSAVGAEDTTYATYTGAYKYVSTGDGKAGGRATATEKSDYWAAGIDIYVKVTLPAGVTYTEKATDSTVSNYVYIDGAPAPNNAGVLVDKADNMIQVKVAGSPSSSQSVEFKFDRPNYSTLDIASDVSGDIKAEIEVMGVSGADILWVESSSVTIAKVTPKAVTVTADDPKLIEAGGEADGAKITIKESQPYALVENGGTVTIGLQIETPDVIFAEDSDGDPVITVDDSYVTAGNATFPDANDKDLATIVVTSGSHALPGTLEITPKFVVPPSVSGDIKITIYKFSGDDTELEKTTVTVATVGSTTAAVTEIKDNDGKVYAGQVKTLDASFKLKAASGSKMKAGKTIILELSAGKFVDPGTTIIAEGASYRGKYNDDKTVWFTVDDPDRDTVKFSNFKIKASGDAAESDIVVKVSGTANAKGEAVIGKIVKPFAVTAEKPVIQMLGTSQAAGDIIITEAGAGAILAGTADNPVDLYVKLPEGVSFDGVPSVKVVSGNISLGSPSVNANGELVIPVKGKSGIASEIKIYNIKYNVGKLAVEGDVAVKIYGEKKPSSTSLYGWEDDKVLATVANATIVSATKRTAVFTLGSSAYTVNGVSYTMDVAAYEKNGRTYLPVRYVAYALGVDPDNVYWDAATQTVTLLKGTNAVQLTIGSNVLKLNGISITMDVAPELVSGRTMLPFRFIAQALGATVSWDEVTKTVTMNLQ